MTALGGVIIGTYPIYAVRVEIPALDLCMQCYIVLQSREKATLYRAVGASDMTTRRQNMPTSQHNPTPEPVEPTCDGPGVHTAQERPIWEVIVEIGANS